MKPEPSEERNLAIYDLATYASWERSRIARVFGVTRERVDQIVSRETWRRAANPPGADPGPRKVPLPAWTQPPPCHQAPCKR